MSDDLLKRIDMRLQSLDISDAGAAKIAGLHKDTIRDLRRGKRTTISAKTITKLATALGTSPSWLMAADDLPSVLEQASGIRFGGIVEAGAFRTANNYDQSDSSRTIPIPPDPRFPALHQSAFQVEGDSMTEAKIFPGMWVHVVSVYAWEKVFGDVRDGRLVVVARQRNGNDERELTVKRLRIFRDRWELQPESSNKTHEKVVFPIGAKSEEAMVEVMGVVLISVWIYE